MHLKLWDFNTLVLLEPFLIRLGPFLPNFLVCLIHGRLRNQSCSDLKYSKVKLLDANCWKIYTIRDRIGTFIIPIGKSFVDSYVISLLNPSLSTQGLEMLVISKQ